MHEFGPYQYSLDNKHIFFNIFKWSRTGLKSVSNYHSLKILQNILLSRICTSSIYMYMYKCEKIRIPKWVVITIIFSVNFTVRLQDSHPVYAEFMAILLPAWQGHKILVITTRGQKSCQDRQAKADSWSSISWTTIVLMLILDWPCFFQKWDIHVHMYCTS